MAYKLGVVGHSESFDFVTDVVREQYKDMETVHVDISTDTNIDQVILCISEAMSSCDGLLYSRYDPFLAVSSRLVHTVPARYIALENAHLLASILRGMVKYDVKLSDISVDSFTGPVVMQALEMLDVSADKVNVRVIATNGINSVSETFEAHMYNYRTGATLCLTNIAVLCSELVEAGAPAVLISPSVDSVVHEINNLIMRSRLGLTHEHSYCVIVAELAFKDRYRFYREMPVRELDEYSEAGKLIYALAEELDGAVFASSRGAYSIVCESTTLGSVTDGFSNIKLMDAIESSTAFEVKIGIGLGKSAAEAAANARAALTRTHRHMGSNTYVMATAQSIIGPIVTQNAVNEPEGSIDDRLNAVYSQTGINIDTIHKLYNYSCLRQSKLYTSSDIAEILGVTKRTANNTIERLINSGHAVIVGKNLMTPKGRPHRVIKLLI